MTLGTLKAQGHGLALVVWAGDDGAVQAARRNGLVYNALFWVSVPATF